MADDTTLPIRRLTLYKHGVAFVQREGPVTGDHVDLVFRASEVNDALKSLLALDSRGSQVLGIHYGTPPDDGRLADSPITLEPDHSLLDLLRALRGWQVRLVVGSATEREELSGRLLGVDIDADDEPLRRAQVSVLDEASGTVHTVPLRQVQQVALLERRAQQDLNFFLESSRSDAQHRTVTVRLSPGEHDLRVSYLTPSPTWRVSYRLVAETDSAQSGGARGNLLLQGWGLFDNPFEEDLRDVAVSFTAGQPISFVYDLAASRIPERPIVKDTAYVAAAPVEFEEAMPAAAPAPYAAGAGAQFVAQKRGRRMAHDAMTPLAATSIRELAQQAPTATGAEAGELFQYDVIAPVSVRRGESALVPILSAQLPYRRELLFNQSKLPGHPVAALRFANESGLVLERGPVTVVEDGTYRGEAVVPFTREAAELYVAFAVELGVKVGVRSEHSAETAGLRIEGRLLHLKHATVQRTTYHIENTLAAEQLITVEHPIWHGAELVGMPEPEARTAGVYRWSVASPPRRATTFTVAERRYDWHVSELLDMPYAELESFLRRRWLDEATLERIRALLAEHSAIKRNAEQIERAQRERETLYRRQEQLRANMGALGTGGEEGTLRRQIVGRLQSSEDAIAAHETRIAALEADTREREARIVAALAALAVPETGAV